MTERSLMYRPQSSPSAGIALAARSVGMYTYEQGMDELRAGRDMVQIFWIEQGCVRFHLHDRTYDVSAGQVFVYAPMTPHVYAVQSPAARWHFWTMDGPLVLSVLDAIHLKEGVHHGGDVPLDLFVQLQQDITDVSIRGERRASATAYALLMSVQQAGRKHYSPSVQKLVDAIENQWSDADLSVQNLSREIGMHRSQLSRMFHQELGIPPLVYLNNRRIQKAQTLLKEGDDAIANIAQHCGYRDPAYFARVFKQHCGMSPKIFRQ